jgi:hypothetical protein
MLADALPILRTLTDSNEGLASRHVTDSVKSWATQEGVPQTPTLQYTIAGDIVLVRY